MNHVFCFVFLFLYLFMKDTQREAETQAEEEAGSMQEARCGTQSQDSRITELSQRQTDAQPLSHPGVPHNMTFDAECYDLYFQEETK